jgi:hypothetical protein
VQSVPEKRARRAYEEALRYLHGEEIIEERFSGQGRRTTVLKTRRPLAPPIAPKEEPVDIALLLAALDTELTPPHVRRWQQRLE